MTALPARIVVGTKNPDKRREMVDVLRALAPDIDVVDVEWPDVAETGCDLAENALLKARGVAAATGLAALADDTGLEVEALGGRPGVHTARFAGPQADHAANRRALLEAMAGRTDRRARFRTVIALVAEDGSEAVVEGVLEGVIGLSERGEGGFGYDPLFVVGGRTLAEVPPAEKNRISHRALALRALVDFLAATENGQSGSD